jgi:hypothetical protein
MASLSMKLVRSVIAAGVLLALAWCSPVQGRWLQDAPIATEQQVSVLLE